mmetsp:Transcript_129498/g.375062  ORF Transcript_129498/g.375062 Transcript_129498/m.375062 type:complete len:431 (+) Transcript_129498:68-1360(+)
MLLGRYRRRVQVEELAAPQSLEDVDARGSRPQHFSLNLLRPARVFLWCACFAECVLIVPNIAAELHMTDDGPHVVICRICLFMARMSLIVAPGIAKLTAHCGPPARQRMNFWVIVLCGTACGSVEPSRGISTALAGWYLISTPMHDAFGAQSEQGVEDGEHGVLASTGLLVPCAMIMAANVCLFLCDALMLTIAPLLRQQPEPSPPRPEPLHQWSMPEVFRFGVDGVGTVKDKHYEATCVICLSDFETGESVSQLPCRHAFHTDCVSEWLAAHSTCPMRCAGYVLPPRPPPRPRPRPLGAARPAWSSQPGLAPLNLPGARGQDAPDGDAVQRVTAPTGLPMGVGATRSAPPFGAAVVRDWTSGDRARILRQYSEDASSAGSLATEELMQEAEAAMEVNLPFAMPPMDDGPITIGLPVSEMSEARWSSGGR